MIINMSVWESADALFAYTYQSDHVGIFRQRTQFFERHAGPYMALWWVPADRMPEPEDLKARLESLEKVSAKGQTAGNLANRRAMRWIMAA